MTSGIYSNRNGSEVCLYCTLGQVPQPPRVHKSERNYPVGRSSNVIAGSISVSPRSAAAISPFHLLQVRPPKGSTLLFPGHQWWKISSHLRLRYPPKTATNSQMIKSPNGT